MRKSNKHCSGTPKSIMVAQVMPPPLFYPEKILLTSSIAMLKKKFYFTVCHLSKIGKLLLLSLCSNSESKNTPPSTASFLLDGMSPL
jgi:hypothetical protein